MSRKYIPHKLGVLALITNNKGEILLTQRNEPRFKLWHKKWQLPGGGVENGETVEETVTREVKEELGVDVKIIKLLPFIGSTIWHFKRYSRKVTLLCFHCQITNGQPNNKHWETLNFKWLLPKEIDHSKSLPLSKFFIDSFLGKNKKISTLVIVDTRQKE